MEPLSVLIEYGTPMANMVVFIAKMTIFEFSFDTANAKMKEK